MFAINLLLPQTTLSLKELPENFRASLRHHAANDLSPMVQTRIVRDLIKRFATAGLRVRRSEYHVWHTSLNNGPGTHRARLQRDVDYTTLQPPGGESGCRLRQGDHLGMGRRVVELLALVVSLGNDPAFERNDDGTHRNFIFVRCNRRFFQGHLHVLKMKGMTRIAQSEIERKLQHA